MLSSQSKALKHNRCRGDWFLLPWIHLLSSLACYPSGLLVGEYVLSPESQSPDPVGSITGDRLHTAALLHNHAYVGFHNLCDLSNLAMYRRNTQSEDILFPLTYKLISTAKCYAPGVFQRASLSHPR